MLARVCFSCQSLSSLRPAKSNTLFGCRTLRTSPQRKAIPWNCRDFNGYEELHLPLLAMRFQRHAASLSVDPVSPLSKIEELGSISAQLNGNVMKATQHEEWQVSRCQLYPCSKSSEPCSPKVCRECQKLRNTFDIQRAEYEGCMFFSRSPNLLIVTAKFYSGYLSLDIKPKQLSQYLVKCCLQKLIALHCSWWVPSAASILERQGCRGS